MTSRTGSQSRSGQDWDRVREKIGIGTILPDPMAYPNFANRTFANSESPLSFHRCK
jgi:hypothetical protein